MTLAGFKDFSAGNALEEGDLDNYLMGQAVMRFATTAARDAAITAPVAGMHVCIDAAVTLWQRYDGSAWRTFLARGAGTPEAAVTATKGALYERTDGAAGTTLYVKASDTTNTGWEAVPAGGIAIKDADESYTRRGLRFVAGSNMTIEIADDSGDDEVEVTLTASSGASSFDHDSAATAAVEATSSTSYTDLTTVGPSLAITVPASGAGIVVLTSVTAHDTVGADNRMSFSGAGLATSDARALIVSAVTTTRSQKMSVWIPVTGLSVGAQTLVGKYRTNTGSATFGEREISFIPLP